MSTVPPKAGSLAAQPAAEIRTGVPLAQAAPGGGTRERDLWLRVALYCTLMGAAMTVIAGLMLSHQGSGAAVDVSGMATYHEILVPLLAVIVVAGVLVLERAALAGILLMTVGTGLALAGGGVWMVPGTVLAGVWAARHQAAARIALGLLLLIPGVMAVYYGLLSGMSYSSQVATPFTPPLLANAANLSQALAPLELLPLALLGAWLLVAGERRQ